MKTINLWLLVVGVSIGGLLTYSTAQAQLVFDFTDSSGTFQGSIGTTSLYTAGSLADGSPSEADPGSLDNRTTMTGSLNPPITDNAVSFDIAYDTFAGSSLVGNDLTATNVSASQMASNSSGIASADGDINQGGRGIFFQFDLTNFTSGYGLRLTDATATVTSGTGGQLQILVGSSTYAAGASPPTTATLTGTGLSVYNLGALTGTGLSIDITDGDYVYFRHTGSGGTGDRVRLTGITLDAFAIPEPSTALLLGLGGGLLCLLRRRR